MVLRIRHDSERYNLQQITSRYGDSFNGGIFRKKAEVKTKECYLFLTTSIAFVSALLATPPSSQRIRGAKLLLLSTMQSIKCFKAMYYISRR
jgi:hypothetical protein